MTPTIALIAVSLIAAGLCVAVGLMQWRINQLNAENDRERARHEITKAHLQIMTELRDHALKEAQNEYQLRRQAEKNLAEANDEVDIHRERVFILQNELSNYSRQRDPKTGRFYSAKPRPTAHEMNEGLAAFDAMMGNAIEQLQGLTVRKLCDEVRTNASAGI